MDKSQGSGKGTGSPLKSWVTARKQNPDDDQDRTSREPQITLGALGVMEGLSHSGGGEEGAVLERSI